MTFQLFWLIFVNISQILRITSQYTKIKHWKNIISKIVRWPEDMNDIDRHSRFVSNCSRWTDLWSSWITVDSSFAPSVVIPHISRLLSFRALTNRNYFLRRTNSSKLLTKNRFLKKLNYSRFVINWSQRKDFRSYW
jgi:hypothetical protein